VESTKTKAVSQWVEIDATPPSLIGSGSMKTSLDVIPDEDHVAKIEVEQVKDIDDNVELFVAIGTKVKSRT